jgi:archaetidylinositol phosphate synthase
VSHDTWAHRLIVPAVRPLTHTAVTPNQLTAVRLALGVAAAGAFAAGGPAWTHLGGGLWIASMLFDRADGILARLTGQHSDWGHKFDLASDFASTVLLFVGIGAGLGAGTLGAWAPAMGVAAGLAIALIFALVYRIEGLLPADRSAVPSAGGFDADDVLLAVGPIAWLGWLQPFLVVAAVGAPLAALIAAAIWLRLRQRSNTVVGSE